ncbi:MAG: Gfo/Idh/MocA family oxidoreductase [Gemmataceae bacterium]
MPLTRRDFLKAGAFAALAPATIRAADGKKAPSGRVRLGCIGVKNQGTNDIKGFLSKTNAANCQIVALCDVDRDVLTKAKEFVEKDGKANVVTYGDYRKLLENKDIDAVVIVTPDHWHSLQTIHACMAGKDVYCEKPLTHTVAEGRAIVNAAKKYEAIVQTGSQQRSEYKGYFRTAAEIVRNGKLGKLTEVRVGLPAVNYDRNANYVPGAKDTTPPANLDYDFWLGSAPLRPYNVNRVHYNFRFFWDYAGGQFTNFGAHDLDIVQWALGMDASGPVKVEMKSVEFNPSKAYDVSKTSHVVLTYADGTIVNVGQGNKDFAGGCTFIGEKGRIHVSRNKLEVEPNGLTKWRPAAGDVRLYEAEQGNHMANWLACVKSRKAPICEPEIGHRSATVCHLCNIAIRTGRPIQWDPSTETIVGDKVASAMLTKEYRKGYELPAV